jgi:hypothetical protein
MAFGGVESERQQQIPFRNDRKKSKGKAKAKATEEADSPRE